MAWTIVYLVTAISLIAGCADSTKNETQVFPVQGRLLFDGEPAAGAKIALHLADPAADDQHFPRATVDQDGSFHLSTFVSADGAPAGEYVMTVRWPDPKIAARDPLGESEQIPRDILNGRYATSRQSNLRVTIPNAATQLMPIDLASKTVRGARDYQITAQPAQNQ